MIPVLLILREFIDYHSERKVFGAFYEFAESIPSVVL